MFHLANILPQRKFQYFSEVCGCKSLLDRKLSVLGLSHFKFRELAML